MSEGTESAALAELAKRRGFFFGSSEAYGGVGGFYTYGPQGAALKSNVEEAWRERFAVQEGNLEIEAPTIMPEPVFEASGHLDGFDDMLVECAECGESHRADHLIEDNSELEDAETLSPEDAAAKISDLGLVCPNCGAELAGQSVEEFNLMFATNIGPGSKTPGYLRPETAQGIFVEFPRIKEYARNRLPFGVTQIGRAYRNEISPRKNIVRTREFTQAELEHFIDPERDEPDLSAVESIQVLLYPTSEQEKDDGEYVETTIGAAVEEGIIANAWIGYFLGIAQEWYESIGVDMDRFRFRQHLSGERAHYSADCWDAESEVDGDWIEIAGFSYRSDYDLSKHGEHGDDDFTVFQQYDEPKTVERAVVDPDMATLGPEFGAQAADVADALETLAQRDPDAFDADELTLDIDGEKVTVDSDVANFSVETQTEAGEHITPHVVEPSFGVDRTVYTLLAHAHEKDEVDGEERTFLSLSPTVAPTNVGVFPLVSNVDELVELADDVAEKLRAAGFAVAHDDSGSIGRRYRRQDEVGTPFCITIDRDGIEGEGATTVTIRERDAGRQVRIPVDDLVETFVGLRAGTTSFDDVLDANEVVEA